MIDQLPKEERGLISKENKFVIPDINEEARMFEWAGIGFGEEETYRLSKSIKVTFLIIFINLFRD